MKQMFDKLTSDNSFRFINHPLIQRSKRVREPQFDVKCLSRRDTKKVLQELDCLLGENEEYEDFVGSTRYRELRVIVANTVWAMNTSFVSNVHGTDSMESSLMRHVISRWKIRFKRSLGSPVDPKMTFFENTKALSGILREHTSDTPPAHSRPELNVHFSSAASMVIFPANSTSSSTSGSTIANESGIIVSPNKAAAPFLTFHSEEKSKGQEHVEEKFLSSSDIVSSLSNVDVGYEIKNTANFQSGNTETLSIETSASPNAPMDRNSDTRKKTPYHKAQQFIAALGDIEFSKSSQSEKQNTTRSIISRCVQSSCCLPVVMRQKLTNFNDDRESVTSASVDSRDMKSQNYPLRVGSENSSYSTGKLMKAKDSFIVISIPKRSDSLT